MKKYKQAITLVKNNRGCYIIDTVKGCAAGALFEGKGCYGDCYAKSIASRYGFDFETTQARKFENDDSGQMFLFGLIDRTHTEEIIRQIKKADMPFIRIGEMGDPSFEWEHTLEVCKEISTAGKPIVIITKHWKPIPDSLLQSLSELKGLCINTSASALDTDEQTEYRLVQYERLKPFCNSVLRIVSCDFNKDNPEGLRRSVIQDRLFKAEKVIDTVFRPSASNPFVVSGVINTEKVKFLKKECIASVHKKDTYFGMCGTCPEMCGINLAETCIDAIRARSGDLQRPALHVPDGGAWSR